jgi:predicted  nucleic acid-binding Zn-ribbon protein
MFWDSLLYLSILGTLVAAVFIFWVTLLGIRYKKELPKLPIKESIQSLLQERDRLEAQQGELEDDVRQAREDIREAGRAREFLEQARPEMEQLQSEMKHAQEAKGRAVREAEEAQGERERIQGEAAKAKEELGRLEQEIAPLKVDLAETKARLERAKEDLQEYEAKREEMARLEAQLPSLREEHAALSASLELERKEKDELESTLNQKRTENARLEGVVSGLEEKLEGLKEEIQRRLETIEELKRLHSSAGGVDEDHDSREDLWRPCFPERHEAGGNTDEAQRLDRMAQMLSEARVRIPRRTLNAFHTALKIQEISPLTVLAGISGTGKSLLPRLYSKCMGLHFLNLPVQPGWNSPQDLFGFYNYIEHRFKATPLARALVQFDQFNRGDWPLPVENESLEDQVLLVLLDEMNLARVEYYFSELLSRLEIRRSIDPKDVDEREKAEIQLEIGHATRRGEAGVEDISVSVYPGENVLFTGTMNEDESTMSLSDKVLDRATVLRFGKPAETVMAQPNMTDMESSAPLALSAWKLWLRSNPVREEIRDAVHELSEIMSKAGAPFGHRVAQGILHYVGMYPDTSPAGQRMALVDQIEQKILPKLRGRELSSIQEAVNLLCSLIHRMEDEELVSAIRHGEDPVESSFMWFGLDRAEE